MTVQVRPKRSMRFKGDAGNAEKRVPHNPQKGWMRSAGISVSALITLIGRLRQPINIVTGSYALNIVMPEEKRTFENSI